MAAGPGHSGVSGVQAPSLLRTTGGWALGPGGRTPYPRRAVRWAPSGEEEPPGGPCWPWRRLAGRASLCRDRCLDSDHLAPSDVRDPHSAAELLSAREGELQSPGLSPPPAAPRCQEPAAAGIRGQRPGRGREGRGGLAVLPPARCTKPALVWRPRMRALGPDLPGSPPSRARGPASRERREGDVPPAADAGPGVGVGGALCQGSWGPARGSVRPWTAGPRPRGPQPVGFSSCRSWAPAIYGGSEGALVTVTPAVGVDGGAGWGWGRGGGGAEEDLGTQLF